MKKSLSYAFVILGAVCWGFIGVFNRLLASAGAAGLVLFHEKLSVWVLLGIVCVLGTVVLLAKEDQHGEA